MDEGRPMTEPYYSDDRVTLYHGDCREITEWLAADVLVTDPPYGRAWKQGDTGKGRGWASDNHAGIANDATTEVRDWALNSWAVTGACGKPRPAIVFGDLMLAPPSGVKHVLVYDKGNDAGFTGAVGGYRRNVEGVYLLGGHGRGSVACLQSSRPVEALAATLLARRATRTRSRSTSWSGSSRPRPPASSRTHSQAQGRPSSRPSN